MADQTGDEIQWRPMSLAVLNEGGIPPVLTVSGHPRGLHGPVLTADVTGKEAVALWEAIELQLGMAAFSEVKRGRG